MIKSNYSIVDVEESRATKFGLIEHAHSLNKRLHPLIFWTNLSKFEQNVNEWEKQTKSWD